MRAKLCGDKEVRGLRACGESGASVQPADSAEVTATVTRANAPSGWNFSASGAVNSTMDNEIETSAGESANSVSDNSSCCNELGGIEGHESGENEDAKSQRAVRMELLVRWLRFNFVGGIGIGVQFLMLFLLKSALHLDYLLATALAVEAAVVHNFIWHERYTWADRVRPSWHSAHHASGTEAQNLWERLLAGLKRVRANLCRPLRDWLHSAVRTRHCRAGLSHVAPTGLQDQTGNGNRSGRLLTDVLKRCATPGQFGPSFARFLRFNLTTGGVSIVGNLALMRVMVGAGQMNYLVANGIAIALCSLANFLVSEEWVFEEE